MEDKDLSRALLVASIVIMCFAFTDIRDSLSTFIIVLSMHTYAVILELKAV